jgi:HD-like signal output (HDOD) protein
MHMPLVLQARDLQAAASRLPTAARLITALHTALHSPECEHEFVCQLVQLDPALSARLVRMANAAQSKRGFPINALPSAVEWLGLSQTYRVVCATLSAQVCSLDLPLYQIDGVRFWQSSVANGVAMEFLARQVGLDSQTAYTLGLFRNLGRIILQRIATRRGFRQEFDPRASLSQLRDQELRCFGCDHADVAAEVFRLWGLDASISETVRHQYSPLSARDPHVRRWACLLHVAAASVECTDYGLLDFHSFPEPDALVRQQAGVLRVDREALRNYTNTSCRQLCELAGHEEPELEHAGAGSTASLAP